MHINVPCPCPTCGRCPTCGQPAQLAPWPQYIPPPVPQWPPPVVYPTWIGDTWPQALPDCTTTDVGTYIANNTMGASSS
jgi:hypothetical protein